MPCHPYLQVGLLPHFPKKYISSLVHIVANKWQYFLIKNVIPQSSNVESSLIFMEATVNLKVNKISYAITNLTNINEACN